MLRLTRQPDYGIVLMTHFAASDEKTVQNARDLARSTNLPLPTVSKILKALARAGLLVGRDGQIIVTMSDGSLQSYASGR